YFSNFLILSLGQSDLAWAHSLRIGDWTWRWMLGVEAIPAIVYFFALFLVPESPRWLVMRGKAADALQILTRVSGRSQAEEDLGAVQKSLDDEAHLEKGSVKDLFLPAMRLVLTIGIVIAILQQITGINSVFFYAPMIFEQSGIGKDAAFMQAVLVGIVNLVATVVAIALIDKLGRRPLLITGLVIIASSMLLLAYSFSSATYGPGGELIDMNATMVLIGILSFVAGFGISLGPVMWVLFSELFPNRLRGIAISFCGLINSSVSFIVQLVFPWELENFGPATTFLIYGSFAIVGLIFVMRVLPETKGRSLEQLQAELVTNK
ncbi:MAG: sugar porter family MFS transporter, partial [Lysobacterales bacterium]